MIILQKMYIRELEREKKPYEPDLDIVFCTAYQQIIQKPAIISAREIFALLFRQSTHNAAKIAKRDYLLFSVPLSQLSLIISRHCKEYMLGSWR